MKRKRSKEELGSMFDRPLLSEITKSKPPLDFHAWPGQIISPELEAILEKIG